MSTLRISEQGFPYCPKCKGVLYWDGDFTKGEVGIVDDYHPEANDTVNYLHCANCNRDWRYYMKDEEEVLEDISTY